MKKIFTICIFLSLNCKGQNMSILGKLDVYPFDSSKVNFYKEPLFIDINSDKKKDVIITLLNRFSNSILPGETGRTIALYTKISDDKYRYRTQNKTLLALIHNKIEQLDGRTFLVINEGSGQDWNRYYCYISYDENIDNWYLLKTEVYKGFYKNGEDSESKLLIYKKDYTKSNTILFDKISFDKLFGDLRVLVPDPPYYGKIKVDKSSIFKETGKITNMYLVKGDEVEIVKEKGKFLKIYYYGKKTIEGWIKKSDIE